MKLSAILVIMTFSISSCFSVPRKDPGDSVPQKFNFKKRFPVNNAGVEQSEEKAIHRFERGWLVFISAAIFGICYAVVKDNQGTTTH